MNVKSMEEFEVIFDGKVKFEQLQRVPKPNLAQSGLLSCLGCLNGSYTPAIIMHGSEGIIGHKAKQKLGG